MSAVPIIIDDPPRVNSLNTTVPPGVTVTVTDIPDDSVETVTKALNAAASGGSYGTVTVEGLNPGATEKDRIDAIEAARDQYAEQNA